MVFICISLICTEIEYFFKCSFENYVSVSFDNLEKNWVIFCLLSSLQILDANSKLVVCVTSIFFFLVCDFFLHFFSYLS